MRHTMVCYQLSRYSFSSKAIGKTTLTVNLEEVKESPKKAPPKAPSLIAPGAAPAAMVKNQTASTRTRLRAKYASAKLYQAKQVYISQKDLEISTQAGDLLGVIQKKDPMGDVARWYVDNGCAQGFVPARILHPIGEEEREHQQAEAPPYDEVAVEVHEEETERKVEAQEVMVEVHSYDHVVEVKEEVVEKEETESQLPTPEPQEALREEESESRPPPAPSESPKFDEQSERAEGGESIYGEFQEKPQETVEGENMEQASQHGYEEIPPSEANSDPSQDISPIYEEINGESRSSLSSGSGSLTAGFVRKPSKTTDFRYSLYDFEATDKAVMLTLKKGQVVRVLHQALPEGSSGDWCYVEDRQGTKGYVPRLYLKPYKA